MESRRDFVRTSAAAMAASKSVLGANDRVQLGVIGVGSRGTDDMGRFVANQDCDVAKSRLETAVAKSGGTVASYGDYRRVLDRKDVDAVLIATPDHWHSPITVDALAAGKDIYVEKPLSNTIPAAQRMLEASQKHQRVVQVGTQQRSWPHFQQCARMIQEGVIGPVTHAVIFFGGGHYTNTLAPESAPPADLDWEAWQGPAPRHPYSPTRQRNWRAFYDYGGGLVTDWGVHLVDTPRMCLDPGSDAPLLSSASAQYVNIQNPDREQVPNAFICSWQYKNSLVSFTNTIPPDPDLCVAGATPFFGSDAQGGDYFYGSRCCLLVNRHGYRLTLRPERGGGRAAAGNCCIDPTHEV